MFFYITIATLTLLFITYLVLDWRKTSRLKEHLANGGAVPTNHDPSRDTNTNYDVIAAQANSVRTISSGGGFGI